MTLGMLPAAASRSHFDRLAETPISVQRMTSDLVAELADQAELLRGTDQVVGLRWEAGDTMDQRRQLINMQARCVLLQARGWIVRVAIERPAVGVEVYAVKIDPGDQDQPE